MATILEIRCAWCGVFLGTKDGRGYSGTTHSICPTCVKKANQEGKEVKEILTGGVK
jgi:uncharacterized Zn finger protein (UPF0148 family)